MNLNLSVPQIQILQNNFIWPRWIREGNVFEFDVTLDLVGLYRSTLCAVRFSLNGVSFFPYDLIISMTDLSSNSNTR